MNLILKGETLQRALNVTVTTIALRDGVGVHIRDLTADEIPLLIADGRFEFVGRKSRVRYVRQLDPSAIVRIPWKPHFEYCYRTCAAAAFWPWVESRGIPA